MNDAVDLGRMPPPDVVQQVDYEAEFSAFKADLIAKDPTLADVLELESEPVTKILQLAALRSTWLRQEFNDRVRALLLAYATGTDLDHVGVTYHHTARLVIDPGNPDAVPPVPPTLESDDDYRARCLVAEDAFSTAGPVSAYVYHAMSAHGDIKDVSVVAPKFERLALSPEQEAALPPGAQVYVVVDDAGLVDPTPASVVVTALSRTGDGTPAPAVLAAVRARLADDVRPITDEVIVRAPAVLTFTVNAMLIVYPGFNNEYIRTVAQASLEAWLTSQHLLGRDITVAGIIAALKVAGVHNVVLVDSGNGTDLVSDLVVSDTEAAHCVGVTVAVGGVGG